MRKSAELPADLSELDAPRTTTRASRGTQEAGTSALSRMLTHSRTHLTACHHQKQRAPPETEQERRPHTAKWSDHGAHEQRRTAASSPKTPRHAVAFDHARTMRDLRRNSDRTSHHEKRRPTTQHQTASRRVSRRPVLSDRTSGRSRPSDPRRPPTVITCKPASLHNPKLHNPLDCLLVALAP